MSLKKWVTGLVILLAMAVGGTNLGTIGVSAESMGEIQPRETVKTIEVVLNDNKFNPSVIMIPNGTTTTLILKNKSVKEHTFTVEKLGIDVEIQPGQEKTITAQPKQEGTYELICRYHIREGMVGKVIVQ
jgi:plastocyanin